MEASKLCIAGLAGILLAGLTVDAARAAIIISEVDPTGSGTSSYKQDWFELTNTGPTAVDITNWKMDDNSQSNSLAVPLRGVSSIAPGQSVVFIENGTDSSKDAALFATFESTWFGATVPAGFTIGAYGGSGVGLSSSTDEVNIFDSTGTEVVGVNFGATTLGATLDNAAGIGGTTNPPPTISTTSVIGTHGAFESADGVEVGSPGVIANAVPEPAGLSLLALGGLALLARRRR